MSNEGQWYKNHRVTTLWSGPDERAVAFAQVPQWSIFEQLAEQQGDRILVQYFGNSASPPGAVWVDAIDLGPVGTPADLPPPEPEWPGGEVASFSPQQIATTLGCPLPNVEAHWPAVVQALQEQDIADRATLIAAIATIGVETPPFLPIDEYGGPSYWTKMYEGCRDLGNTQPGDGARYHGRGFIQLTGRANYRSYGRILGQPLEDRPDLALQPDVAARVLAVYFKQRDIPSCAASGDWRTVRIRVNGGLKGWTRFSRLVQALGGAGA